MVVGSRVALLSRVGREGLAQSPDPRELGREPWAAPGKALWPISAPTTRIPSAGLGGVHRAFWARTCGFMKSLGVDVEREKISL